MALLVPALLPAAPPQQAPTIEVKAPRRIATRAGAEGKAVLQLIVPPGLHVNSTDPGDPFLKPLRVRWVRGPLQIKELQYPTPQKMRFSFWPKPISVYTGTVSIHFRYRAAANAPRGFKMQVAEIHYQLCSDTTCYPPRKYELRIPVQIR